jgi:hypothetical protein
VFDRVLHNPTEILRIENAGLAEIAPVDGAGILFQVHGGDDIEILIVNTTVAILVAFVDIRGESAPRPLKAEESSGNALFFFHAEGV